MGMVKKRLYKLLSVVAVSTMMATTYAPVVDAAEVGASANEEKVEESVESEEVKGPTEETKGETKKETKKVE